MKTKVEDHKKPVLLGKIVLVVILIIGIGGLFYWINSLKYVYTDDAAIDGDHVSISAKISGRISNLLVDEGAKVEAGQLLVQLDDTSLRASQLQSVTAINSAKQNLILAKVNLDKAQEDFDRTKTMFEAGNASKQQYDHDANAVEAAKVSSSYCQAQIEYSKAQLGVVESQLIDTKITASIPGIIAKRFFLPGEVVQPGQAIFTLNNLNHIWVTANYEETKIRLVHPNESVEVSIDAYPWHTFKGKVIQVSAGVEPPPFQISDSTKTTQKIPVKILLDPVPASMPLVPGMSVEAKIKVK
jgi:membrane fusion protein (multidrug efflux system)